MLCVVALTTLRIDGLLYASLTAVFDVFYVESAQESRAAQTCVHFSRVNTSKMADNDAYCNPSNDLL